MLFQASAAAVVCIAVFEIIYWVKFTLKTPVPIHNGTRLYTVIHYTGTDSAALQATVESAVYFLRHFARRGNYRHIVSERGV